MHIFVYTFLRCPVVYVSLHVYTMCIHSNVHLSNKHAVNSNGLYTLHYSDVIMSTMTAPITSLTSIYSTVYSGADQRKHQRSASLAFVRGIHRSPVNSPHKWPVTRKMFSFNDVIMGRRNTISSCRAEFILDNTKIWQYLFHQLLTMTWQKFRSFLVKDNDKPSSHTANAEIERGDYLGSHPDDLFASVNTAVYDDLARSDMWNGVDSNQYIIPK